MEGLRLSRLTPTTKGGSFTFRLCSLSKVSPSMTLTPSPLL